MFCTKCGSQVPDGNAFCTTCGNKVGAAPVKPAAPVEEKPVQTPVVESEPKGEKKPIKNPFGNGKSMLAKIMSLVCVALLLVSYFVTLNTSVEKIPLVSLALGDDISEFDEMKDDMADLADQVDTAYEREEEALKEVLSKSEIKDLENLIKVLGDCGESFSLNNVNKVMKHYEKLAKNDAISQIPGFVSSMSEAEEIMKVIGIVKTVLLVFAIVCCVFLFFGGFCHKPGLAIFGTVLSVIFCLSFCTILFIILNLAAQIYMIIVAKQAKREKKAAAVA